MWVVVHTCVGFALGALFWERLGWPWWLVAVVVLVSHPLLDLIPHWDYVFTEKRVAWGCVDLFASLATCVALPALGAPLALVVLGPVSGAPDLDVLTNTLTGSRLRHWFPSHWDRFPHGECGPRLGVALQVAIMAGAALVVVAIGW